MAAVITAAEIRMRSNVLTGTEWAAGQWVQRVFAAMLLVLLGMSAYAPAVGIVLVAVAVACAGLAVAVAAGVRVRIAVGHEPAGLRLAFRSPGAAAASAPRRRGALGKAGQEASS